jgi:hypothetical protein
LSIRGLLIILLLGSCIAEARNLPQWQSLTFQQQARWVSAEAIITVDVAADNPANWALVTDSTVASNREHVRIELVASNGRSLERSRYSAGRQKRLKQYQYHADEVVRQRRSQPDSGGVEAEAGSWPVSGRQTLPYPSGVAENGVINAYSLLFLAADALPAKSGTVVYFVHTDRNFYRVESQAAASEEVEVEFLRNPGDIRVSGARQATAVTITATADESNSDKPDFEFFGLRGEVTILYDDETGIPLQLRGIAPRLGAISLNLTATTLRSKP